MLLLALTVQVKSKTMSWQVWREIYVVVLEVTHFDVDVFQMYHRACIVVVDTTERYVYYLVDFASAARQYVLIENLVRKSKLSAVKNT